MILIILTVVQLFAVCFRLIQLLIPFLLFRVLGPMLWRLKDLCLCYATLILLARSLVAGKSACGGGTCSTTHNKI